MMKWSDEKKRDVALLVLRVTAGAIFVFHGYGKLLGGAPGMAGFTKMVTGLGFPLPDVFAWAAALSEFVGGIALILGLFPRIAAVFTAMVMLVALFMVKKGALPKADPDYALLAMSIAIMLMGGGRYALGRFLPKRGTSVPQGAPAQSTTAQK